MDLSVNSSANNLPPITVFLLNDEMSNDFAVEQSNVAQSSPLASSKAVKVVKSNEGNEVKPPQVDYSSKLTSNLGGGGLQSKLPNEFEGVGTNAHPFEDQGLDGKAEPSSIVSQETGKGTPALNLSLPMERMQKPPQKNYAELANQKLSTSQKKDLLAEGIEKSIIPNCKDEKLGGGLLGLPVIVYKASIGKCY